MSAKSQRFGRTAAVAGVAAIALAGVPSLAIANVNPGGPMIPACVAPHGSELDGTLHLTDRAAGNRLQVITGDSFRVVSRFGDNKMTEPAETGNSTGAFCPLVVHRFKDGAVAVTFLARVPGLVHYQSSEANPGGTLDPYMHGRVRIVAGAQPQS